MPSKNVPSLENLINQCCESYYSKLNESVEDELNFSRINSLEKGDQPNQYYSYEKFQDFISASHCQENLKFLIEIYHYEKIWNKTFKRQSSILKCKDEENYIPGSRKQSVATIRTMNSRKSNRHPSIVEEVPSHTASPPPQNEEEPSSLSTTADDDAEDPVSPITTTTSPDHRLSHNDLDKLVHELSLPKILNSGEDLDTNSFVNQNIIETTVKPQAVTTKKAEVWDTLFKPSYMCENNSECACAKNDQLVEDDADFNEAIERQEILEQLKEQLREKFEYIITNYVIDDSSYQINLPDTVHSNLMKEYQNDKILYHSPLTLLPAKNAVLQLLRENIYYNFLVDQENLLNRSNSQKIIKKMDQLKITSTNSAPKVPTINTAHTFTAITTNSPVTRELRPQKSEAVSLRSLGSEESIKSGTTTPISAISNFLQRYHIKIHNSQSSSSLSSAAESSSNSNTSQSQSPITKNSTRSLEKGKFQHKHHQHSSKYVKGPCGIDPVISDYDPHPPPTEKQSKRWSRMTSKFKHKK